MHIHRAAEIKPLSAHCDVMRGHMTTIFGSHVEDIEVKLHPKFGPCSQMVAEIFRIHIMRKPSLTGPGP